MVKLGKKERKKERKKEKTHSLFGAWSFLPLGSHLIYT
jgi:hypothetical protein